MSRRTIQSPGVEIREIDLTQRPAAAVGTSVFIAGFSNQGPTDEVFNVGTFAEFEQMYGQPTNAAERYFYHSARQVFNSDSDVFVSRLPYGTGDGQSTEKYSALVYPVKVAAVNTLSGITTHGLSAVLVGDPTVGNIGAATGGTGTWSTTGANNNGYFEIVSQDSSNNIKYTTLSSAVVTYKRSGVTANHAISAAIPAANTTALSAITGDTIIGGAFVSGGDTTVGDISANSYYILGNPAQVELTRAQYVSAAEGNISWGNVADLTPDIGNLGGAGVIVLNKAKVSTNQDYEGHYVGITDNSNLSPSSDYDAIGTTYATTSALTDGFAHTPTSLAQIPTARYDFNLTSTFNTEKPSLSRSLENISTFDLDGGAFVDTLTIAVFKVRITPFSNTDLQLSQFLAEGYAGSLNSYRKIQNENGGNRKSFFIEDLDNNSPNVKILVNPNISKNAGDWTSSRGDGPTKFVRTVKQSNFNASILEKVIEGSGSVTHFKETPGIVSLGAFTTISNTPTKNLGSIPTKLDRVFNIASNVDQFNIDVSIEAGLGTIFAVSQADSNNAYDDTKHVTLSSTGNTGFFTSNDNMVGSDQIDLRDNYRTIFNRFETFARSTRKDHIFIADVLRPLVVQGTNGKVLDDKNRNFSQHVYWPLRHQFGFANSNFATTYGNWAKIYDGTSNTQTWIPFSGVAAKIYANNDANFAPWYAPAGFNRGIVTGVNDIAVSPTQRQRDQLYRIAINPVTQFPAEGIVVFGQKTLQRKPTAFDRVNVRRCFLDLEKRTRETLKFFIFEPNTFLTRNKVVNTLTPIFENCKQTEGVYDYLIVCDDRNNPASVIDENELRIDIYLKPVRAAEFILVNFYAINTDVNFEEIVGQ